jgi:hypothetical protein
MLRATSACENADAIVFSSVLFLYCSQIAVPARRGVCISLSLPAHFVTFCCYHRRRLLTTDASRLIFESALERVRSGFGLQVYGYVVMPEHVHLLLSEP